VDQEKREMADLIEETRHSLGEQADACYRSLAHAFAKNGIGVGRAPIDYQDYHMAVLMPTFLRSESGSILKK
jgi:hypothetical protein